MEQVQVRILGIVSTNTYGNLEPGTVLRTDAAFARHLVEDCAAAEYINAPQIAAQIPDDPQAVSKPRAPRKAKEPTE